MATGISIKRGSGGKSERNADMALWPPNDAARLLCNVERQLGRMKRKITGRMKSHRIWTLERIREAYEKVAKDEIGRLGIAHEILTKKHGLLAEDHCASRWRWEESLCRMSASTATVSLWRTTFGGYRRDTETATTWKKKHCSWWCAVCGGKYEWRAPNRILVVQLGTNANEAKVFKSHAAPQGLCENLINALKLLANKQKDGDRRIQSIVTGLHERRQKRNSWTGQEVSSK